MQPDLHLYAGAAWITIGVVWLVTAVSAKRAERSQTGISRVTQFVVATVGFTLVFGSRRLGSLNRQFLPDSVMLAYLGLAITVAGIGFAMWARLLLGGNWSAVVTIKEGHNFVRKGPYNIVRHPIYSGGLFALIGTALVIAEWRCLIGILLVFLAWWSKLRLEEQFLREQFGAEYVAYQREVKALIPFVL